MKDALSIWFGMFAFILGLILLAFNVTFTGQVEDRIARLESRCIPIEQAGSRESGWDSSQPLGGGELIHYE